MSSSLKEWRVRSDLPEDATPSDAPSATELGEGEQDYAQARGVARPTPRPDASMTLLTSMLERPLDPGYQAAAEARMAQGKPPSTGTRRLRLLVWLLLIGLLIGVCTAQLRDRDGSRAAARADLIRQIEDRQGVVDERGTKIRTLQSEIDVATGHLDPDLVGTQRKDLEDRRVTSGLAAVQGPGVRLTLDDAQTSSNSADGDPRTGVSDEGRVRSSDMQVVTNALWQAGAEAITINGQRLTSRTAIRFAGEAILVNFRPLTRPYTIEAIGDPNALQTSFAEGQGGSYLTSLRLNYGIQTSLTAQDELTLASAVNVSTREATVVPDGAEPPRVKPLKKETS